MKWVLFYLLAVLSHIRNDNFGIMFCMGDMFNKTLK